MKTIFLLLFSFALSAAQTASSDAAAVTTYKVTAYNIYPIDWSVAGKTAKYMAVPINSDGEVASFCLYDAVGTRLLCAKVLVVFNGGELIGLASVLTSGL